MSLIEVIILDIKIRLRVEKDPRKWMWCQSHRSMKCQVIFTIFFFISKFHWVNETHKKEKVFIVTSAKKQKIKEVSTWNCYQPCQLSLENADYIIYRGVRSPPKWALLNMILN